MQIMATAEDDSVGMASARHNRYTAMSSSAPGESSMFGGHDGLIKTRSNSGDGPGPGDIPEMPPPPPNVSDVP